jgi:hypothetical protein
MIYETLTSAYDQLCAAGDDEDFINDVTVS